MLWRFRRSIQAMNRLSKDRQSPASIVRFHKADASKLAFRMDYYPGGHLEDIARRKWDREQKLTIFTKICQAVEFAHHRGVIHRDIKPANVVLTSDGIPVLTDFDIADIQFVSTLSVATGGLGTPVFAAPEQIENGENATEQSDIYSLGRLLHFMLLERSPGLQIEHDPNLENLARFLPALVAIVRKATQFDPVRRHRTVSELIDEVERHQTGIAAFRARAYMWGRWIRQNIALIIFIGIIMGGMILWNEYQRRIAMYQHEIAVKQTTLATVLTQIVLEQQKANNLQHVETNLRDTISAFQAQLAKNDHIDASQRATLEQLQHDLQKAAEEKIALVEKLSRLQAEAERAATEAKDAKDPAPIFRGCFTAEAQVELDGGQKISIANVRPGMKLRGAQVPSLNESIGVVSKIKELDSYFSCTVNSTTMTGDQPLWTQRGWVPCQELNHSDLIRNDNGHWSSISNYTYRFALIHVYAIKIEPEHTFYANGLLAHNKPP